MNFLQSVAVYIFLFVTFYVAITVGISQLPPASPLPSGFTAGVDLMFSYIRGLNFIFPMDQFLAVLSLVLTFTGIMWATKGIFWAVHLIRGNSR